MGDYLRIGGNNIAGFKLRVVRVECGWRACLVVRACNGSVGHAYDNEQDGKAHDEVDESSLFASLGSNSSTVKRLYLKSKLLDCIAVDRAVVVIQV